MDFSKNITAFLSDLPKTFSGPEKFLAVAIYGIKGDINQRGTIKQIKADWRKSVLKIVYNPAYYNGAQKRGWTNPVAAGVFEVTQRGLDHLIDALGTPTDAVDGDGGLFIFDRKNTHTFDKFLRTLMSSADRQVCLADSYVDETIFDNVLDSIARGTTVRLIYGRQFNAFNARAARFKTQYSAFTVKEYKKLHDRFIIVDGKGYIIGPSIKDAADKSPALVVKLSSRDSRELIAFFESLWSIAK